MRPFRFSAFAAAIIAAMLASAPRLGAQSRVQLQGIVDGELWSSSDSMATRYLSRKNGSVAPLGRVQLWGAFETVRGLALYGHVAAEQGSASLDDEVYVQQLGFRYTNSAAFVLDAGRFPLPIGTFAARRFSNRNPLIGQPDGYPPQYPEGLKISGATEFFDYRAAMVDLPAVHEDYTPAPTKSWRPVVGFGVTPYVGLRLGASYTAGPYLNDQYTSAQLGGRDWKSYWQRVTAADLAFSIGYFELTAEAAQAKYDVPSATKTVDGYAYYAEGKYTITPRLFLATRLGRNDYPFIQLFTFNTPAGPGFVWVGRKTDFHDEEYGLGFRVTTSTLVKASYHHDTWHVDGQNSAFVGPGGHAFVFQLSQAYDVMDWIERARVR